MWETRGDGSSASCTPGVYRSTWPDPVVAPTQRAALSGSTLLRTFVGGDEPARDRSGLTTFDVDAPGLYDPAWKSACRPIYDSYEAPSGGHCAPPTASDYGFFADPSCSSRAVFWGKNSAIPPQIARVGARYVRVGAAYTGQLYMRVDGRCAPQPALDADAYLTVGPELDSREFPQVRWDYQGADRLQASVLLVGDVPVVFGNIGTSVPGSVGRFRDAKSGSTCVPVRSPHAGVRCFPGALVEEETDAFADARCTMPLYYKTGEGVSAIVKQELALALPRAVALVTFDSARRTNTVYRRTDGACVAGQSKPDLTPMTVLADDWGAYAKFDESIGLESIP